MNQKRPTISVLIPTLNAERVLDGCLSSFGRQNYPREKIEIIIADGGSTDKTLAIAGKYRAEVIANPLKTGEAGKAAALKKAKGELIALIDSDNFLPEKNWLRKMVKPFEDKEILGSEPWRFTYREKDNLINRYCALIGANDPYCYFIGNYDKISVLSGKWTGIKLEEEDKGGYLKVKMAGKILPTIGANGTIWRTEMLKKAVGKNDYLFDNDVAYILLEKLLEKDFFYFAKVKTGIIHLYCRETKDFYRKQKRRVKDFFYFKAKGKRKMSYQTEKKGQLRFTLLRFVLPVVFLLPLFCQAVKGYLRKKDKAWFFHPWFCGATLFIYGRETVFSWFKKELMSRREWCQ